MKISVIMLTYNREQLVARAVESILAQSFSDFEFIIVDNGSTDSSGAVCERYAACDSRIRVIRRPRGTIGSGRNTGLDAAKGDYITFVDDDDRSEPELLEFLYRLAQDEGADIALCGSYRESGGQRTPQFTFNECLKMGPEEAVMEYLRRKKWNAAMPTKLLRRSLFDSTRFFEDGNYDDIRVGYRLFANASKTAAWGKPLYSFSRHENNNSKAAMSDHLLYPEQLEEYFAAFRERTEYLSQKLPAIADYAQYSEWSYLISMCRKINANNLTACKQQLCYIQNCLVENFHAFYDGALIEDFERSWMDNYIRKLM